MNVKCLINDFFILITCWDDSILNILSLTKYIIKIDFSHFFCRFNVATRTFKITRTACTVFLVERAGKALYVLIKRVQLLSWFYRWGNWHSKSLGNLPKVTQLLGAKVWLLFLSILLTKCSHLDFLKILLGYQKKIKKEEWRRDLCPFVAWHRGRHAVGSHSMLVPWVSDWWHWGGMPCIPTCA